MEQTKKDKVLNLIANRILQACLNSNVPPPARIRFVIMLLEIYADAMVRDHIVQTLSHVKVTKDGT